MTFNQGSLPSRRHLLTALGLAAAVTVILFASVQSDRANRLDRQRAEINEALLDLANAAGYGGFIHSYKNYLLRPGEIDYRLRAEEGLDAMETEIARIERIAGLLGESLDFAALKVAIGEYREALIRADRLIAQGLSAREVDAELRIDSTRAIDDTHRAAKQLRERIFAGKHRIDQWNSVLATVFAGLALATYAALAGELLRLRRRLPLKSDRASD